MVGLVEVTWRFDGSRFAIEIVRGGEVLYSTARDVGELDISIVDIMDRTFKKNKRYTSSGMVTKVGSLISAIRKCITSSMDIWVIEAIMESGVYPLCYEVRRSSYDDVLRYLSGISSERIEISENDVVIFRMPEKFVTVRFGRVTVFPYDAEKISVMQMWEYDEASAVMWHAVNNGIELPKDVESVLSYYVVAYRMLKGGGVK
jgi:hypothetical protein